MTFFDVLDPPATPQAGKGFNPGQAYKNSLESHRGDICLFCVMKWAIRRIAQQMNNPILHGGAK
jgi:hypothetical protein